MGHLDFTGMGSNMAKMLSNTTERTNFLRYAVKEWAFENAASLLCIADFRGMPTKNKLMAFYDIFVDGFASKSGGGAPLALNLGSGSGATEARKITVLVDYLRNGSISLQSQSVPANTLSGLVASINTNLSDTFSRYDIARRSSETRFKGTIFSHKVIVTRSVAQNSRLDPTTAGAVRVLKSAGFDTHGMGFDALA
jgi:hypothetical protein